MFKILTALVLLLGSSYAATFNVNTSAEFRQALKDTARNGEDNTIVLADGTYQTTDDGNGTFVYLSNTHNKLYIKGSSSKNVILSGDHQDRVLLILSTRDDASLYVDNISFNDGNSTNSNSSHCGGAALFFKMRSVTITDSSFDNNDAGSCSGGAINQNSDGYHDLTIVASDFTNNTASEGGAINVPEDTYDSLTVKRVKFINNKAYRGGAIRFASYYTFAEIVNSMFIDNKVLPNPYSYANLRGGAIDFSESVDHTKIINCLFMGNNNTLYYTEHSDHKIYNSVFSDEDNIIKSDSSAIGEIYNSYINENHINMPMFTDNNIFDDVNLGFVDEANGNYKLTASSDLIDAGISEHEEVEMPKTDIDGNSRPIGVSTDIGP